MDIEDATSLRKKIDDIFYLDLLDQSLIEPVNRRFKADTTQINADNFQMF